MLQLQELEELQLKELEKDLEKIQQKAISRLNDASKVKLEEMNTRRGIVIHPALVGRELSWATARVDFGPTA